MGAWAWSTLPVSIKTASGKKWNPSKRDCAKRPLLDPFCIHQGPKWIGPKKILTLLLTKLKKRNHTFAIIIVVRLWKLGS